MASSFQFTHFLCISIFFFFFLPCHIFPLTPLSSLHCSKLSFVFFLFAPSFRFVGFIVFLCISCISSSRFWFIGFFAILMFLIILLSIFFMFFAIWLQDFFTPLLCCKFHFIMTLLQFAFCVWFVSPNKRYVILPLRMLFCSIAPQINFLTFHNLPLIYMFFGYNFT